LHPGKIDRETFEAAGLPTPERQTTVGQYPARPQMTLDYARIHGPRRGGLSEMPWMPPLWTLYR